MAITIQLPDKLEQALRRQAPDLDAKAREHFVMGQYQAGNLGTGDVAEILGLATRFEAQTWLMSRNVPLNYSMKDLDDDRRSLDGLFGSTERT
jgi:predicted HTH domain antitoxin